MARRARRAAPRRTFMTKPILVLTALFLAAGALATAASGCELIAVVDRTLIPGTGGSTSSGTGGAAGMGGSPGPCNGGTVCQSQSDCPVEQNDCVTFSCAAGCCAQD